MNDHPLVYVLVLNFNQSQLTIGCVESIIASDYPNFKIIVVDNGSDYNNYKSLERIIDNKISIYRLDKNIGYVGGMNYALKEASTKNPDYYLVLNNDAIIEKAAITHLVNCAQRSSNNCIVSGKVYHYDRPDVIQYIGSKLIDADFLSFKHIGVNEIDNGQFEKEEERDLIDDIYWLLPNTVYSKIGGYNELFYFNGESADYCMRAKNEGFLLLYCPLAKLWHKGGASIGGRDNNSFLAYYQTKSTLLLRFLHLKHRHFTFFYCKIFFNALKKMIKGIFKVCLKYNVNWEYSLAEMKGWMSFSNDMLFGRLKRKKDDL